MDKLTRACAYCRVSTLLDKQETSLSSQIKYYNDLFDNSPDLINAGVYIDQGISGRTISRRKEFQRMLRDCREGRIDVVYCKSILRFGRNTIDTLQSIELLKKLGIPVLFEVENINTLTDKDFNTVLMSYMAEEEVKKDVEYGNIRVKHSFEKGQLCTRLNSLLGYDWDAENKKLKVNPETAKVVKMIFDLYVKRVETREIAKILNDAGYKTVRNTPFTSSAILRIIHQEKYTGNMRLAKFYTDKYGMTKINHGERRQYFVENSHEPIISQELFDKAQKVCQDKRLCMDSSPKEYDPFRLMITCGACGKTFKRCLRVGQTNERARVAYRCGTAEYRGAKACRNHQSIKTWTFKSGFMASFNKLKESKIDFNKSFQTLETEQLSREIDGLLRQEKIYIQMNINGLLNEKLRKEYSKLVDRIMELQKEKKRICSRSLAINELTNNSKIAKTIFDKYEGKMTEFDEGDFCALIRGIVVHSKSEIEFIYKMGLSVTVKYMPYLFMDDEITEVIINDTATNS